MRTITSRLVFTMPIMSFVISLLTSCGDKDYDKKDVRSPRLRLMTFHYVSENPQWENSDSVLFQYNNNNQLIAMGRLESNDSIGIQYDSRGRISSAAFLNAESEFNTRTYSWSGNTVTITESDYADAKAVFEINGVGRVVRTETHFLNEGQWHMVYYMLYNWTEGNLVSTESWQSYSKIENLYMGSNNFPFILPELPGPDSNNESFLMLKNNFKKDSEVHYTYDNKNNPYKDNQLYKFSGMGYYSSANNVRSSVRNGFDISGEVYETYTNNYSFTYNSENYPLVRSESDFAWSITETYLYE